MAAIAEFYSKNLSAEAKKGLHEKAKRGGTPGYAPLGYINGRMKVDGREVKTVEDRPGTGRAHRLGVPDLSSGEWSITELVTELERRGIRTRPTASRLAKPLVRSQVHRILRSPYYAGWLPFGGVEYSGTHPPLVDEATWQTVQEVLSGRRLAGDRAWRHDHYLKGSLFCGRCRARLGISHSTGKTGTIYPYFYCLGRNKKRSDCQLPYLAVESVERAVARHWRTLRFSPALIAGVRRVVYEELAAQREQDEQLLVGQRRRLKQLETKKQKLIDAYLAEALSVTDLKPRQEAVNAEAREAERLIALASADHVLAEERLEVALGLLAHCDRLYATAADTERRQLNQAFFSAFYVDSGGVTDADLNPPFAELRDRSVGLEDGPRGGEDDETETGQGEHARGGQERSGAPQDRPNGPAESRDNNNPACLNGGRGSNVSVLADLMRWLSHPGEGHLKPSPCILYGE